MLDFVWNDILLNPMTNALILLSNVLFDNFGLAIIAFTILIRLATYPLTRRQLRTTRAMQEMQPRLKELQKKYKDPKRRQQEMMKVYREVGFNPLGCAVPFMIQIPIWISLFQVVRRTLGATPEALFDLSHRLYDWSYITEAVPLSRSFLVLDLAEPSAPLAVLVAVATFYQQKFTTVRAASADERSAATGKMMIWMLPIMFGFFTLQMPSGLGVYWVVTGLFGIVSAYLYNKPKNLSWRWAISLEALPPRVPATATASGAAAAVPITATASAANDTDTTGETDATDEPKQEKPDRSTPGRSRRRRRRRRSGGSGRREGSD